MSVDKVQYPKYLYHHSEQPALVLDAEEHELFGDEWKESPAEHVTAEGAPATPTASQAKPAKAKAKK